MAGPKSGGFLATQLAKHQAIEGETGKGEETIWRFVGWPTFKTVPRPDTKRGGWQDTPHIFILHEGKWKSMGQYYWHSPLYDPSRLPGWHPIHLCGMFCDGQDGNGECHDQKCVGPPLKSPLLELAEGACLDDDIPEEE